MATLAQLTVKLPARGALAVAMVLRGPLDAKPHFMLPPARVRESQFWSACPRSGRRGYGSTWSSHQVTFPAGFSVGYQPQRALRASTRNSPARLAGQGGDAVFELCGYWRAAACSPLVTSSETSSSRASISTGSAHSQSTSRACRRAHDTAVGTTRRTRELWRDVREAAVVIGPLTPSAGEWRRDSRTPATGFRRSTQPLLLAVGHGYLPMTLILLRELSANRRLSIS